MTAPKLKHLFFLLLPAIFLLTACGTARASTGQVVREAPRVVFRGENVNVTLTVRVNELLPVCPPPPDAKPVRAVLVIDKSGSMEGEPLAQALEAAQIFIGMLNLTESPGGDRVAIVAFNDIPETLFPLSFDDQAAVRALRTIQGGGGTDIAGALAEAAANFSAESGGGVERIIVLLSDGKQEEVGDPIAVAERIKASGVRIVTIALGEADRQTLSAIASDQNMFYGVDDPQELVNIYSTVAAGLVGSLGQDVSVQEPINTSAFGLRTLQRRGGDVREGGTILRWETPFIGRNGWRTYYQLRPLKSGWLPITASTGRVSFVGCDEIIRRFETPAGPRVLVFPFPRWILYILPVLLLVALAVALMRRQPRRAPAPVAPPKTRPQKEEQWSSWDPEMDSKDPDKGADILPD